MSESAEERLNAVRSRQQEMGRQRAQAEARLDEVHSRKARVLERLREEFEVEDISAAQDKLVSLREVSDAKLTAVEKKLKEMQ